ncbi:hypothetical protein [Haloarcula sediminis]|uniref:hypothetical protein n=1 Tax=Haloarcula sediminis TaxID=3111777 RepID=UPI002D77E9EE|nr:hypothetical protein [Haloarcula sp. CK38]
MRRVLFVLCALVAVVGLIAGTGGFTSAEADRSVAVEVVGDDDAYMALDYSDETITVDEGESVDLSVVAVTNQFTEAVTLAVDYTVEEVSGLSTSGGSESTELGVGNETDISTTVTCDAPGEYHVSVEFGVTADGDSVSAATSEDRSVEYAVTCEQRSAAP